MERLILDNDIKLICKKTENTPRIALTCFVDIKEKENTPGVYVMLNRLFTQGTKTRTAEQIAYEIEKNGLDIYSEMKSDYWKFSLLCLKEDFETAVELLSDMMQNSTLETFNKELEKLRGETVASLDSPTVKARDEFVRNLYQNHQYGHSGILILENIENITKEDVSKAYEDIFKPAQKVFSVVGDIAKEEAKAILEKYFANLQSKEEEPKHVKVELNGRKVVKIPKKDANQAQIYQGWFVPGLKSKDSAALSVLNTILGSSGLSSRLFLELRDKKGLAYTVRSIYTKLRQIGDFRVYIATEPKNIKVSLEGFKIEIDRLKCELVSEKELYDAKNNIIGKVEFLTETNLQKAGTMAAYEIEGLGFDYLSKWLEDIKKVSAQDVMDVANRYLNENYVLTILAPQEAMKEI